MLQCYELTHIQIVCVCLNLMVWYGGVFLAWWTYVLFIEPFYMKFAFLLYRVTCERVISLCDIWIGFRSFIGANLHFYWFYLFFFCCLYLSISPQSIPLYALTTLYKKIKYKIYCGLLYLWGLDCEVLKWIIFWIFRIRMCILSNM